MERERVLLVGGPGDGLVLDIPAGLASVAVHVMTDEHNRWVQVSDHPRGGVEGLVVAVGSYARTAWDDGGRPVFRFRGSR